MQLLALLLPLTLMQSGPQVQITNLKSGAGETVKAGDRVKVDYTGKLTNGKQFDSSIGREPFEFIVGAGEVIKGWDKGLIGMKVGGKRTLRIPPALGYGATGAGNDIPPNATLIFDIELKGLERVKTEITKKGSGEPVFGPATVQVHYRGKLANGKEFDSSYGREPLDVTIGQTGLIPGFTMGLVGMRLGEKRTITIPPALGYGSRDVGPIPANSTLIFELELVKVVKR
jgi:FKBP-type peptidyl-prolyl cis-trans isomerase